MASAAMQAISASKPSDGEKIFNFSPERLKAPFALRCAALSIDYMVLLAVPAGWLVSAKLLAESGAIVIGPTVWVIGVLLFLANFVLLPLIRGQSVGKMLTGLTILSVDGTAVRFTGILSRNVLGYLITVLTFGIGFLVAAVNPSGRALHDFIARTVVVRGRKTER